MRIIATAVLVLSFLSPLIAAAQPPIRMMTPRFDWNNLPPGIVFALTHNGNQRNKVFVWQGTLYRMPPCLGSFGCPPPPSPPPGMSWEHGGDLGAPKQIGYLWFESVGDRFTFTPAHRELGCDLPPGLVLGLKHSRNQFRKTLAWVATLDPAQVISVQRFCLERQGGGDRGAPSYVGFFWYETTGTRFTGWDTPMPPGMVFGLKHSLNQPGKVFLWRNRAYDPARRDTAPPPRFERHCGGDLGAPAGHGFCWFETTGEGWPY
jgi:hypothetical protein